MGELAGGEDLSGKWVVPHTPHSLGHCPRAETLSHGQQFVVACLFSAGGSGSQRTWLWFPRSQPFMPRPWIDPVRTRLSRCRVQACSPHASSQRAAQSFHTCQKVSIRSTSYLPSFTLLFQKHSLSWVLWTSSFCHLCLSHVDFMAGKKRRHLPVSSSLFLCPGTWPPWWPRHPSGVAQPSCAPPSWPPFSRAPAKLSWASGRRITLCHKAWILRSWLYLQGSPGIAFPRYHSEVVAAWLRSLL